ncbi:MAG: hypothetical protein M3280_07960 [Actinomycetota bacterium]|nr:hypothetical protein [Actinomycetota bacterium]
MGIKAKLGAGVWDMLFCEACGHFWTDGDLDYEWTDDPDRGHVNCPSCHSDRVTREERG